MRMKAGGKVIIAVIVVAVAGYFAYGYVDVPKRPSAEATYVAPTKEQPVAPIERAELVRKDAEQKAATQALQPVPTPMAPSKPGGKSPTDRGLNNMFK